MLKKTCNVLLFTLFSLAVACGGKSERSLDESTVIGSALGESYGGLTADDEKPFFDQERAFREISEASEDPVDLSDDPIEMNVAVEASDAQTQAQDENIPEGDRSIVYGLFVTWGRQHINSSAKNLVVWDPKLSTDCGVLGIRRLIGMEVDDGVVRPRTSSQAVSFSSKTGPAFDGVSLVLVVRARDRACTTTGMLRFESAALDKTLELPLDTSFADTVLRHSLGDENNVTALAHQLEPLRNDTCVKGYLRGRWIKVGDAEGTARDDRGRFYGRATGPMGGLRGHIKGIWGVPLKGRHAAKKTFFGKYIDTQGKFKGLFAGRYGDGKFGGGWHLRPKVGELKGLLGGHYVASSTDDRKGGLFRGRYASSGCHHRPDEQALED